MFRYLRKPAASNHTPPTPTAPLRLGLAPHVVLLVPLLVHREGHRTLQGGRVQGSGFRVQGSGFRIQGAGFRVQGAGLYALSQFSVCEAPPGPGGGPNFHHLQHLPPELAKSLVRGQGVGVWVWD